MEVGELLEIQVVEEARHIPEMGIAAQGVRIALHRRGDHQGVMALVVVVDVGLEERVRL